MHNNYLFIYENPKVFIPARTKRDEHLKEMITFCHSCGRMDLAMSMGCESNPEVDLCMQCYDIGYQNIETESIAKIDRAVTATKDSLKITDITPRNIMIYRSCFPYYYHCINAGKHQAFLDSINQLDKRVIMQ